MGDVLSVRNDISLGKNEKCVDHAVDHCVIALFVVVAVRRARPSKPLLHGVCRSGDGNPSCCLARSVAKSLCFTMA